VIKKQVNSTYTDPTRKHADDKGHIEGNMVFTYLDFFGDTGTVTRLKEEYTEGKVSDVAVKEYLFKSLMKTFTPARKRYEKLKANPQMVKKILEEGAAKARIIAAQTMKDVRDAIGVTNVYSISAPITSGVAASGDGKITIDDFARVDVRVGKVIEAKDVEKSEKLIRLVVDFNELGKRIIFTAVRQYGYTAEFFLDKRFFFVVNIEYRKMMGEESQGMIVAVDGPDKPLFLPGDGMPVGARIR
jgi:methionine--tRNA ligase beta chain